VNADYDAVKPESEAYGKYANAQIHELIAKYHPMLLWNDIDWPKTARRWRWKRTTTTRCRMG